MRVALPVGTVTLVLGDLEGSVRSWERDASAMAKVVGRLDSLVSEVAAKHGGVRPVEQGEGDSFVLAFSRASAAVACAVDVQLAVAREVWPGGLQPSFRVALHTGELELRDEGNYAGPTVNRCARLRDLGHGVRCSSQRPRGTLWPTACPTVLRSAISDPVPARHGPTRTCPPTDPSRSAR